VLPSLEYEHILAILNMHFVFQNDERGAYMAVVASIIHYWTCGVPRLVYYAILLCKNLNFDVEFGTFGNAMLTMYTQDQLNFVKDFDPLNSLHGTQIDLYIQMIRVAALHIPFKPLQFFPQTDYKDALLMEIMCMLHLYVHHTFVAAGEPGKLCSRTTQ
jgi:hypothetical protein